MFRDRDLVIATKHQKENVIAPVLEKMLGVRCMVPSDFDSDELGTFSGEIERKDDPLTTAKMKCMKAMELTNCDLAIASEGSFGPHPSIYFVPADEEFIYLYDKKNDLEIWVRELSTETNFNATEVRSEKELKDFLQKADFPSHGVILRKSKDDYSEIIKGICDWESLNEAYRLFSKSSTSLYIETDMRAMYNPSRMKVIKKTAEKLSVKILSLCPNCHTPGFGITSAESGLPCGLCSSPTRSTLYYVYSCSKCAYVKEETFPNGKRVEDPMYCDSCNP